MKNYRLISIILILLISILCIGICVNLDHNLKNIVNYTTIIGTSLSLIGIIIAYLQILSIKNSYELVSTNVNIAIQRLNQVNRISDLSRSVKLTEEIQNYIKNNNYMLALLRMRDVKYILISIKHYEELISLNYSEKYQATFNRFVVDLNNLNSHIEGTKKIDIKKINNNLEEISTQLSHIENHLKNKKHEYKSI